MKKASGMTYPRTLLSRRMRRTVMVLLIAVFFVVAPLAIAYTAGYRYNLKRRAFEQTGVISIDAEPGDSRVFLNTVEIKKKLPLRLANRAPGTYHVKIEREGYQEWQKDITVESKQTTYIKNIALFPESLPTPVFDRPVSTVQSIVPSESGAYAILTSLHDNLQEITLFHAATKQQTPLVRKTPDAHIIASWSPSYDLFFLAIREHGAMTVHLFDPADTDASAIYTMNAPADFENADAWFQWQKNPIIPSLLIRDGASLISLSAASQETTAILGEETPAWFVDTGGIVWIWDPQSFSFAAQNDDATPAISLEQKKITRIIDINDARILASDGYEIILAPRSQGLENRIQRFANAAARFHPETNEWFIWSPWELWTVYENGDSALLNRTTQATSEVLPLDTYGVLLLTTERGLSAFNPGYYTAHDLFTGGTIEKTFVNQKDRLIYFLGTVGNRRDLYELKY